MLQVSNAIPTQGDLKVPGFQDWMLKSNTESSPLIRISPVRGDAVPVFIGNYDFEVLPYFLYPHDKFRTSASFINLKLDSLDESESETVIIDFGLDVSAVSAESRSKLLDLIRALHLFAENVRDSLLPGNEMDDKTVKAAEAFLIRLYHLIVDSSSRWTSPHIATDGEGGISLEWWQNGKALTVFVCSSGAIEYLKAWGPHIWNDMEEGENPIDHELLGLWKWLCA
jgi:hypothetical protein